MFKFTINRIYVRGIALEGFSVEKYAFYGRTWELIIIVWASVSYNFQTCN